MFDNKDYVKIYMFLLAGPDANSRCTQLADGQLSRLIPVSQRHFGRLCHMRYAREHLSARLRHYTLIPRLPLLKSRTCSVDHKGSSASCVARSCARNAIHLR